MKTEQLLDEIRDANLSYLVLAQHLIRQDRAEALFRLGISEEVADVLEGLSTAQILKIAASNLLMCRFRFDDAVVWNLLFSPQYGPINQVLHFIGIANPPTWLQSTTWAMPATVIVSTWRDMGYYMILFLAGLQTVPRELHEAARVDGASVWQRFWNVTMPCLRPTTFFVTVMLTINSFKIFDLILVMTNGGPGNATLVLSQFIYQTAFVQNQFGYASAASIVLFFICIIVTIIQFLINKRRSA